ncbi:MAG: transposase [bacterium]
MISYKALTEIPTRKLLSYAKLSVGKFYDWQERYGIPNRHTPQVPKAHWLLDWEKSMIIAYYRQHEYEGEGYRRLCYRMVDENVAYASPSSVYRVLKEANLLSKCKPCKESKKGRGYVQPMRPHQEWRIEISYVNVLGTFLFLIAIIHGYFRYIVAYDLRASMEESDVEIVLQRAYEKFPNECPRVISERGGQFISKEFNAYIRNVGLTHRFISVGYPQSNGKLERFFGTAKRECIRRNSFLSIEDARKIIDRFIEYYNNKRLHSAIDYVAPLDILLGKKEEILKSRDEKLRKARELRVKYYNQKSVLTTGQDSTLFHDAKVSNFR